MASAFKLFTSMDNPQLTIHCLERSNNPHRTTAMSFSWLAKLAPICQQDLRQCRAWLRTFVRISLAAEQKPASPLLVGLTESGIIISALLHQELRALGLEAHWLCSTRRKIPGVQFNERHSHSPCHYIKLPENSHAELWIVEDEITSGRTILSLSRLLWECLRLEHIRILALADTRSAAQAAAFHQAMQREGVRYSSHAMVQILKPGNGDDSIEVPMARTTPPRSAMTAPEDRPGDWYFPEHRPGLRVQGAFALALPQNLQGTLLAVGEAIDLGLRLLLCNPAMSLQHVTLSPWKIDRANIHSRLEICGVYHLYNFERLKFPLHILCDPADGEIGNELRRELWRKGFRAEILALQADDKNVSTEHDSFGKYRQKEPVEPACLR